MPEKEKWIETKREYAVLDNGKSRLERYTTELKSDKGKRFEKKDWIDYSFKLISALAIAIPIILFYKQRENEIIKQRSQYQLDVITNTSTSLANLLNQDPLNKDYEEIRNRLFIELKTKMRLLNDQEINSGFNYLDSIERLYYFSNHLKASVDSLFRLSMEMIVSTIELDKGNSTKLTKQQSEIYNQRFQSMIEPYNKAIYYFKIRKNKSGDTYFSFIRRLASLEDIANHNINKIRSLISYKVEENRVLNDDIKLYMNAKQVYREITSYFSDEVNKFSSLLLSKNPFMNR